MSNLKDAVRDFWEEKSCGEVYAAGQSQLSYYESHGRARYELEPYILPFADFAAGHGKDVLEIGVGMGADHVEWAKAHPRSLTGIDLTERAVEHTRQRLAIYGLASNVRVADAEALPFDDESFDLVYSWGVLHHSPDTHKAVDEVHRVLRPGGTAKVMIYHKHSLVGLMLWGRYGLLRGQPFRPWRELYAEHLESPGTKAFSVTEAKELFAGFDHADIRVQLSFGDLLQGAVGQRHRGLLLAMAKRLWPRWLLRRLCRRYGLAMLITARK